MSDKDKQDDTGFDAFYDKYFYGKSDLSSHAEDFYIAGRFSKHSEIAELRERVSELERVIKDGLENAEMSLPLSISNPQVDMAISTISHLGFGAIMQSSAKMWREVLPKEMKGGEFCVGPCVLTQENWIKKARAVLNAKDK